MADAHAQPISSINPRPFIAHVAMRPFVARGAGSVAGMSLSYLDQDGRTVGSSLVALDDVEAHARDLLASVAAARMTDTNAVPIDRMPRACSTLMHDVRIGGAA